MVDDPPATAAPSRPLPSCRLAQPIVLCRHAPTRSLFTRPAVWRISFAEMVSGVTLLKRLPRASALVADAWLRRLRLWSGLLLFVFLTTHLINHSLGLWSLDSLDQGRRLFLDIWRSQPGTLLLYGALLFHLIAAVAYLYRRRNLNLSGIGALRLALGLIIPIMLVPHLLGTRAVHEIYRIWDNYAYILLIYFEFSPWTGIKQAALVVIAWLHASIGVHLWLRFKPWYNGLRWWLFAGALLLPTVALLGVWTAGREVLRLFEDPSWAIQKDIVVGMITNRASRNFQAEAADIVFGGLLALLLLTLGLRLLRQWWVKRHGGFAVIYPDGRRAHGEKGMSILDVSRRHAIPHASLCGGRGRCSTCRVRVGEGFQALPEASKQEEKVLVRVRAAPNVRLACQTQPRADVTVTPLLPPDVTARDMRNATPERQGEEREAVVLFADLREFTQLAEDKLPYDVVFLLNRYFANMGEAVQAAGGRIDKFIGDGVMALFATGGSGTGGDVDEGCRQALRAAAAMAKRLTEMNESLEAELPRPLRMGIGIHVGPVILGEMGYGTARSLTAIGDVVNTASRLEASTKAFQAQVVVSDTVVARSGMALPNGRKEEIQVRGRVEPLQVWVVEDALELASV